MAFAFGDSITSDFATSIDSSMNFLSRILPPPMKIAGFERKSTCNSRSWSRISFACSSVTQRIVFFYIIRQNCFLFAEDCVYMLILYTHIVQSTNFPYNFVVHSYNTCFKFLKSSTSVVYPPMSIINILRVFISIWLCGITASKACGKTKTLSTIILYGLSL